MATPEKKPPQEFEIPEDAPQRSCSSCGAAIFWILTRAGKPMPVRRVEGKSTGTSHFIDCPNGPQHRRRP
jgi:hypothetical protein